MKTKKYLKIASLAVVAAIFIWTFVFLYRTSQPGNSRFGKDNRSHRKSGAQR